jgi:type I restriction enzyme M protein
MYLKGEPVEGELAVIIREQVEHADYNLSPSRWVGQTEVDEHKSIRHLTDDLRRLSLEAVQLDQQLFKSLERLS